MGQGREGCKRMSRKPQADQAAFSVWVEHDATEKSISYVPMHV